jgi:hypothetical protein
LLVKIIAQEYKEGDEKARVNLDFVFNHHEKQAEFSNLVCQEIKKFKGEGKN